MGEGMGFPGTDADTGATAARGCNALLMNTKNFIKDCLYIKLSTKLCPITPVAPFHAWKLLAAATVRHRLFHPPIPHHSLRHSWIVFNFSFVHVSIHDRSNSTSIETMPTNRSRNATEKRGIVDRFVSAESIISQPLKRVCVYRVRTCIRVYR